MTASATARATAFEDLGLSVPLLQAINAVGYEVPTPIQAQTIPPLLGGRDVIGQAQTGTGKTAAFALPMLDRLEAGQPRVQALALVPTRELALQVAEAIHTYARDLGRVRVLPVNGGQPIDRQRARLRGGVQIIVGTPGRIMDHLRRETLSLEALKMVVLDEADEMLRMGFIEDVEWILAHAPGTFQTALFAATMPAEVRRLAARYLKDPVQVAIQPTHVTVPATEQYYLNVPAVGTGRSASPWRSRGATSRARPSQHVGRATGDRQRLDGRIVRLLSPPVAGTSGLARRLTTMPPDLALATAVETMCMHVAGRTGERLALVTPCPLALP